MIYKVNGILPKGVYDLQVFRKLPKVFLSIVYDILPKRIL